MKRATSKLIDQFMTNVRLQYVIGREHTSGPAILTLMEQAFRDILAGADPDKALRIERLPGGPAGERSLTLALIMHMHRGEKVLVQETYANKWLEANGHKSLSAKRLRKIRQHYRAEIEQREAIIDMVKGKQRAPAE